MTVKYEIKEVSADNIKELQQISRQTFLETFGSQNSAENMKEFLDTAYAEEKLKDEVENANSSFYFLTVDNKVAGYLKVNEGHAQTEQVVPNALEVERIYLKQAFQHQGLGLVLIKLAGKIAKKKRRTICGLEFGRKIIKLRLSMKKMVLKELVNTLL